MNTLIANLNSLWQVMLAALLLGAGLPTVFAIGVRCWSAVETENGDVVARNYSALAGALACLVFVLSVIIVGILYTAREFLSLRFGIHLFGER